MKEKIKQSINQMQNNKKIYFLFGFLFFLTNYPFIVFENININIMFRLVFVIFEWIIIGSFYKYNIDKKKFNYNISKYIVLKFYIIVNIFFRLFLFILPGIKYMFDSFLASIVLIDQERRRLSSCVIESQNILKRNKKIYLIIILFLILNIIYKYLTEYLILNLILSFTIKPFIYLILFSAYNEVYLKIYKSKL